MKTKIALFIAIQAVLGACAGDDSNYDYKAVNDVEISGIEAAYSVNMLDRLEISPVLTRSLEQTEADLEYVWTLYDPVRTYNNPDTLAKTRNLDIQVDIAPGDYTVSYRVKDRNTGVGYRREFKINITSEFQRGFMALSEVDGKANVTFINVNGKLYEDIYYSVNGEYAGTNPVGILYTYRSPLDYVAIVCDDERGGVYAGSTSFKRMFDFRDFFFEGPSDPYEPQRITVTENYGSVSDYQAFGSQIYFMNRGRLHLCDVNYTVTTGSGDRVTVESKFYSEFPGDYDISPVSFHALSRELFFDRKGRRFMYIPSYAESKLYVTAANPDGVFDPADVGMDLVWGKFTQSPRNTFYCNSLFRDDDGAFWYLKFDMTSKNAVKPVKKVPVPAGFNICNATQFTGNSLEDYIYFAAGSKVFVYDCMLNQEREIADFADIAGSGCRIDLIRWHDAVITDRIMHVCVSEPGQAGKNGSIYVMGVAAGGASMSVKKKYENVCGRVVGAHWKN